MKKSFFFILSLFIYFIYFAQAEGQKYLRIKTRKLSSQHDLSYPFYSSLTPFCEPEKIENSYESIGDYLFGDRIQNSVYNVSNIKINFSEFI